MGCRRIAIGIGLVVVGCGEAPDSVSVGAPVTEAPLSTTSEEPQQSTEPPRSTVGTQPPGTVAPASTDPTPPLETVLDATTVTREMEEMFGAECLAVDQADFANTVPVNIDLSEIPTPVEETGRRLGPYEEKDIEYRDPDDARYWQDASVVDESGQFWFVGYSYVPFFSFDVDPAEINVECHPEAALYDEQGVLIGGFIDGLPRLLDTR